ncbi:MAG TPA: Ig-like domain-containing protein [bacterium]|nr:Ig-like domain-containing protein [bacterium]HOH06344.1 Ig-like domain-containing protein [bacterium]
MKRNHMRMLLPLAVFAMLQAGCPNREPVAPIEITRPKEKAVIPAAGTLAVPLDASIQFQFTEPMSLPSFTGRILLQSLGGSPLPGSCSQVDSTVFFKPDAPLDKATLYTVELRGGIRDARMNTIEVNSTGAFSDTVVVTSTWFFSAGDYSIGGFNPLYLRDRKEGSLRRFTRLDSLTGSVSGFTAPEDAVVTPDGRYIVVANTGKNEVAFVDASSLALDNKITVAATPSQVEVAGDYLYVISVNGKTISKINLQTKAIDAKFTTSFFPGKLALNPDGSVLYTMDQLKRDLVLINTATGAIIKTLPAVVDKLILGEIRTDPFSGALYICDAKGLKVKRSDAGGAAPQTIYTFPAGSEPIDIAFSAQYHFIAAGKSLYKYDAATGSPIASTAFATACKSVTAAPTGDVLFVTLATSMAILDARSLSLLSEVPLASSGIESVVVNPVKFTL